MIKSKSMNFKIWFILASSLALLSVAMGAFAAHALKEQLGEYELSIVETAARYQMYHALAMFLVTLLALLLWRQRGHSRVLLCVNYAFTIGILLFSGSLYALALLGFKWLVYVTPIGGIALLVAWILLIRFCAKTEFESILNE